MLSKRFLLTLLTLAIIGVAAAVAVFLAKGYRFSPQTGTITGTGIISVTSLPDQASVYLDNHLTTATNDNINSLIPKEYEVKIIKEGYIPWQKKVQVQEGLVTEIEATLYRSIPSVYPLTYSGIVKPLLSVDGQKLMYVVPPQPGELVLDNKKSGVWVWNMSDRQIGLGRSNEPHQIALFVSNIDYTNANFRWSPDGTQILVTLPDRYLLLDENRLNDPPRDITANYQATLKSWDDDEIAQKQAKLELIKDFTLRKTASDSAVIKWSPDQTKILYSQDGKSNFKVTDLTDNKTYDLPTVNSYSWLKDSEHLVTVENTVTSDPKPTSSGANRTASPVPSPSVKPQDALQMSVGKISVIEFDGNNKSEIFVGNFAPQEVFVWPDGTRIVIVSSLPTPTASQPNLYGINLQ